MMNLTADQIMKEVAEALTELTGQVEPEIAGAFLALPVLDIIEGMLPGSSAFTVNAVATELRIRLGLDQ